MKKLKTQITKNNKTQTIAVMVDDQTAKILEGLDEKIRHEYIVSEYETYLIERKETRRHQSFEMTLENGHEFEDEGSSPEEKCIENEKYSNLHKAICSLSEEQQWLVKEVYFKGRSQVEIAKELGITKSSLNDRLSRALKKIKKICT